MPADAGRSSGPSRPSPIDLRPVRHHLENRIRVDVLLPFLAAYLTWRLCRTLAELTPVQRRAYQLIGAPNPAT